MTVTVLVGNPRPRSRTWSAAHRVATELAGREPDRAVDVVDLGPGLLGRDDPAVAEAVAAVAASDLLVVASPTYKATYTGLLKLFLDRIGTGQLAGVTAVPVMLGGDLRHSLAADVLLKPVLVELGATCPTRGLFLIEASYDAPDALAGWIEPARRQVAATAHLGV
jgi:FMN reductase